MNSLEYAVWTRERPTEPGWYWIRSDDVGPAVVHLVPSNRGLVAFWPGRLFMEPIREADYDDAEWCGPIDQPP